MYIWERNKSDNEIDEMYRCDIPLTRYIGKQHTHNMNCKKEHERFSMKKTIVITKQGMFIIESE